MSWFSSLFGDPSDDGRRWIGNEGRSCSYADIVNADNALNNAENDDDDFAMFTGAANAHNIFFRLDEIPHDCASVYLVPDSEHPLVGPLNKSQSAVSTRYEKVDKKK